MVEKKKMYKLFIDNRLNDHFEIFIDHVEDDRLHNKATIYLVPEYTRSKMCLIRMRIQCCDQLRVERIDNESSLVEEWTHISDVKQSDSGCGCVISFSYEI